MAPFNQCLPLRSGSEEDALEKVVIHRVEVNCLRRGDAFAVDVLWLVSDVGRVLLEPCLSLGSQFFLIENVRPCCLGVLCISHLDRTLLETRRGCVIFIYSAGRKKAESHPTPSLPHCWPPSQIFYPFLLPCFQC